MSLDKPAAETAVHVKIVNAFTRNGTGGNPAGVVLDADGLDEAAMQRIAAKAGLSETAFVSSSDVADFKLDFFTPTRRIAHCGHATIGTFSLLAAQGRVAEGASSKETVDGPRAIEIAGGAAFMEQLAPKYSGDGDWGGSATTAGRVLASLKLATADLMADGNPVVVNTGNRFMLVGVRSTEVLSRIVPDQNEIHAISDDLDLIGYYVYAMSDEDDIAATTRMFAPRYGIAEETATGMAAGPLGCLLRDRHGAGSNRLMIEQGRYMTPASPSLLDVRLKIRNRRIAGLMAGGYGKVMEDRAILY